MMRQCITFTALSFSALLLVSCQSSSGNSAKDAAEKNALKKAGLQNTAAFCRMVDDANTLQAAAGKPIPENLDCEYFAAAGTLEGFSYPTRNQYTGFFQNIRDISHFSAAMKKPIPTTINPQDKRAADVFRKLLVRGFDDQVAVNLTTRSSFKSLVSTLHDYDRLARR